MRADTDTLLNPEHLASVIDLINRGPYFRLLSMEIRELRAGYARVEIQLEEKHLNPFGGLHGGVYASLIDTAAYWAVYGDIEENAGLTSLDLSVDNLAAASSGLLVAEGRRIKAGRSICLAAVTVSSQQGKLLAHGTSKQLITQGIQSISQATAAMGRPDLPPKFLPRS